MTAKSWRDARFGLATVRGASMQPALYDGDVLLVRYAVPGTPQRPAPGRLVVVRLPPDDDGHPRPLAVKRLAGPAPDGEPGWWVERDNPRVGVDSWTVGAIPADDVLAAVVARVWPPRWRAPWPPRPPRPPLLPGRRPPERHTRRQGEEAE